ncbi:hypothetical protein HNQ50_002908 [Silvimonas terrae]|jgi:hypothetical protein|uniref:Uncharacterized protein n=1 Tax=Silvimonas terrae TaxID=300266 RepID=A0A840RJ39_9NEIS|nr:hypothetical protein [Silvimonas terrae]MBB5192171.1 hypothetical protein [Silvimonas terrae]
MQIRKTLVNVALIAGTVLLGATAYAAGTSGTSTGADNPPASSPQSLTR